MREYQKVEPLESASGELRFSLSVVREFDTGAHTKHLLASGSLEEIGRFMDDLKKAEQFNAHTKAMSTPEIKPVRTVNIEFVKCIPSTSLPPTLLYVVAERWTQEISENFGVFFPDWRTRTVYHLRNLTPPMSHGDCEHFVKEYNRHPESFR